jgi:shikimate dehydrogenase
VAATLVTAGVQRFMAAEVAPLLLVDEGSAAPAVAIAGIGTTAAKAVRGALLTEALSERGYQVARATPYGSPDELMADPTWQLGVVLSPWKRDVPDHCDRLAPSAGKTGVVDTIVRAAGGTIGFNTNTWAAASALEFLLGGAQPGSLLLLGAGASARSVALAVQRMWPECQVCVAARSPNAADLLVKQFPALLVRADTPVSPDVVVNTTTWGETEASETEPLGIDLEGVLKPGAALFDLNNRVGALPVQALQAGCAVISGTVMQRVTNACRAALVIFTHPAVV